MRTHSTTRPATTSSTPDFVDITDEIQAALTESRIRRGQVLVFAAEPHCTIVVNELESGLLQDIAGTMQRLRDGDQGSNLLGSASVVLPAEDGKVQFGTWQRVLLVELGAPTTRSVVIQIWGE